MTQTMPAIEGRPLAPQGTLAGDLLAGDARATNLLPRGAPRVLPGMSDSPTSRPARLAVEAFGTSTPAAATRLERILQGEGLLVSTGQQPALFLGPLYVLHKTLTAIEWARRIEERLGVPALAVFWIASDDHDWEEVARTHVLTDDQRVREIRVPTPPPRAGRSVGPSPLTDGVLRTLEEFLQYLPESEYKIQYMKLLQDAYVPDRTFAAAFAAGLQGCLGSREWVWIDAAAPAVKQASAGLLQWALTEAARVEECLAQATARVRASGYDPQLRLRSGISQIFYDDGHERSRLTVTGDGSDLKGPRRTLEAWSAALEAEPECFSPAAALRPVVESWLMPVTATVLGPGEIGYWAQLTDLFKAAEVTMPTVVPRFSWQIIEPGASKVLDKLGERPEALADGGTALRARVVENGRSGPLEASLTAAFSQLAAGFEGVEHVVATELPGMKSAVGRARKEAERVLFALRRTLDGAIREREAILLRQIARAAALLYPGGKPQERVRSPFEFLVRYGEALVAEIERAGRCRDLRTPGVAGPSSGA